jgi:hypothetical protein
MTNAKFGVAIIQVLNESFRREPMCAVLGLSPGMLAPLTARFISGTTNGLSVVAMRVAYGETLAAAFIYRTS